MTAQPISQPTPTIAVVVCTYNRRQLLEACLATLHRQVAEVGGELVVVDDGSTDDTQLAIERAHGPVLPAGWRENRGLNAARNEGIRASTAPILLFFDDDQLAPAGYLRRVLDRLDDVDADGVGGPVRDRGDGPRTCSRCSLGDVSLGDVAFQSSRLPGGNMAVRRRLFEAVGMFDERLSGRGDESEWFARAAEHRFVYDPELWVWHRRDHLTLTRLCRHAFRQGRSLPAFAQLTGAPRRGHLVPSGRFLAHALLHRCAHGLELLSRELGALAAARPQRRSGGLRT